MKYLCIYYIFINIILFIIMFVDKQKAKKHRWRIPENTLFLLAYFGGAVGGFLGMFVHHHKTKKPLFYFNYTFGLALHIALLYMIIKHSL